jgi:pimeloyl-ACP methyl ester carboxylesterase
VGHDWGSPVVWSLATHHAAQCQAIASLCVPYLPDGFVPEALLPYVDRKLHPVDQFPAGQWEYQLFYAEHFERASATFDADPERVVRALFRRGSPEGRGKPSRLAFVRRDGGWFGGAARVPDFPRDTSLLSEEDMHQYASALARNGFFGPDSWYVNAATNGEYARRAPNPQRIDLPVLFLHARDDYVCETLESRLADPMRAACPHLTEHTIASGHWMAQERPVEVNGALAGWLARLGPDLWP